MVAKYGNTQMLENQFYKSVLKGRNSKEYLGRLKDMANKFKADFDAHNMRTKISKNTPNDDNYDSLFTDKNDFGVQLFT